MRLLAGAIVVLGLVASALSLDPVAFACPPRGFDSMTDFDQSKFLSGTWHAQLQANGFLDGALRIVLPLWLTVSNVVLAGIQSACLLARSGCARRAAP